MLDERQRQTWKLALAYDGTDFSGWQVQPGLRTVQGELSEAIARVTGERVLPQGSGRTDAGVHAEAQVASFEIAAPVPEENLAMALNRTLPKDMRVLSAAHAAEGFHARHSAVSKTYEYRIFRGALCLPFMARYVFAYARPLDMDAMKTASAAVMGEHDFTSFAASDPDASQRDADDDDGPTRSAVREITHSEWSERGELLCYRVSGSGFLHRMVRNLVGTFLTVGRRKRPADDVARILLERRRGAAGPTAPASGLFLINVSYEEAND
jgi:tRNA pseudouridine38-40 synthase